MRSDTASNFEIITKTSPIRRYKAFEIKQYTSRRVDTYDNNHRAVYYNDGNMFPISIMEHVRVRRPCTNWPINFAKKYKKGRVYF